jgi:hypothetical protein
MATGAGQQGVMSAMGHKRTLRLVSPMSALPPKADMIELLDASRTRPVRCDRARQSMLLDRLRRREAALISTSDGKRIISQLSF